MTELGRPGEEDSDKTRIHDDEHWVVDEPIDSEHASSRGPRRQLTWWIAGAAGLIVAVTLAIVLPLALGGGTHVRGMVRFLTLAGPADQAWDTCRGTGDVSGLQPDAAVRIRDGAGSVIGFGRLRNLDSEIVSAEVAGMILRKSPGWETIQSSELDQEIGYRIDGLKAELIEGACTLYFDIAIPRSEYVVVEVGESELIELGSEDLRNQDGWLWILAPKYLK